MVQVFAMCSNCRALSVQVFTLLFLLLLPESPCSPGRCNGDSSTRAGAPLGRPQGAGVPTPLSQPEKGVPSTQVGGPGVSPCPWGRNLQPACRARLHGESGKDPMPCFAGCCLGYKPVLQPWAGVGRIYFSTFCSSRGFPGAA